MQNTSLKLLIGRDRLTALYSPGETMHCTTCGALQNPTDINCPACGKLRESAPPMVTSSKLVNAPLVSSNPIERPDLEGIGGWLLVFVVGVGFLALAQLTATFRAPDLFTRILEGNLAGLSAVTVILVAKVKRAAFMWLRIYFVGRLLFAVLVYIGSSIGSADTQPPARNLVLIRSLLYASVWFMYFKTSKRVRATFGRNI
jgi:hypothetical protein